MESFGNLEKQMGQRKKINLQTVDISKGIKSWAKEMKNDKKTISHDCEYAIHTLISPYYKKDHRLHEGYLF